MKAKTPIIYLASRSPRRRELLNQIGVCHKTIVADINEHPRTGEAPAEYVIRLALEKARAAHRTLGADSQLPVLAADTSVVVDNEILGKPLDRGDALTMMQRLSGCTHIVLTGVALVGKKTQTRLSVSHVSFRTISPVEAAAYWETGEPQDKAGGYAIQGLGAMFISRLEGSYSGVMGLPLFETAELLSLAGVENHIRTIK
ncbi:Septum formation protein Maf [hydrothermal vent metagenome]|uniref:Septum formation protein Maf n=1 Tax=hydrothermal vent metagenome TaxID=652676 RepID=A0A3B1B277_9ZZZZ